MKLVVTGGAGYIGSTVATMLLEAGHEVIVLDNLSHAQQSSVPKQTQFIKADIADFASVFAGDKSIDAVLHFAAFIEAGESVQHPEKYWHNNVAGTLQLLSALKDLKISKLIFSSTAAVYGNPDKTPITETASQKPNNPYGMTKLAIDMAITSYCQAYGLAATSLRYFNVAGSYKDLGERHEPETHIIPRALAAAATGTDFTIYGSDYPTEDGTCIRDYIHVSDLARAHLLALEKLMPGKHNIYNLGNGKGFSNREVVSMVEEVTGKKLNAKIGPRREGDPDILVASSKLAESELGWSPDKPELQTIIQDAWQFYLTTQQ